MTAIPGTATASVMFADTERGLWGAAVDDGGAALGIGAIGSQTSGAEGTTVLEYASADDGDWRISGPEGELIVAPVSGHVAAGAGGGFSQLCEVRGTVLAAGAEHALQAVGVRVLLARLDGTAFGALREVSAWFARDDGLVLTAVRPPGVRGHDHDVVAAAAFEPTGARAVADPRLSTTYVGDGRPKRVGLELWLDADDEETQYPVRATGAATGDVIELTLERLSVQAHAMRWQSRGREGPGAYVLAHPR